MIRNLNDKLEAITHKLIHQTIKGWCGSNLTTITEKGDLDLLWSEIRAVIQDGLTDPLEVYICPHCNGSDLLFDSYATWSKEYQEFQISDIAAPNAWCYTCELDVEYKRTRR